MSEEVDKAREEVIIDAGGEWGQVYIALAPEVASGVRAIWDAIKKIMGSFSSEGNG